MKDSVRKFVSKGVAKFIITKNGFSENDLRKICHWRKYGKITGNTVWSKIPYCSHNIAL